MVICFLALSLGSWLWYALGSAQTQPEALPAAVAVSTELWTRDMLLLLVYGLVEQGLEHRASFTTMASCMLFCICAIISCFCWKAHRTGIKQAAELIELQRLFDALWAEQKDDKLRIRELAQENTLLSQENAFLQMRYYEQDQMVRIPQEICTTEHGRCFHHRSCHTIRQSTCRAYYACKECVTKHAADVY